MRELHEVVIRLQPDSLSSPYHIIKCVFIVFESLTHCLKSEKLKKIRNCITNSPIVIKERYFFISFDIGANIFLDYTINPRNI